MSKIDPEAQKRADTKRTTGLPTEVAMWLTPNVPNVPNGGRSVSEALVQSKGMTPDGEKKTVGLESQTRYWATPQARDTSPGPAGFRPNISLAAAQFLPVSARPTPAARDSKGPNSEAHVTTNGTGRMHMDQLANFVAFSPLVQQTPDGEQSSPSTPSSRRHLNPLFGSWLMGWPSTWVIAEPHASSALATASFHCALQQRLSYFFDGQAL